VDAGLRGVFLGKWIPWARGIVGSKVPLHFGQFTYFENVWKRGATIGLLIVADRFTRVLQRRVCWNSNIDMRVIYRACYALVLRRKVQPCKRGMLGLCTNKSWEF
jgi:hypothetical protein